MFWRRDEKAFLLRSKISVLLMRRPQSGVKSLVSKELVGLFNSRFSQDVEDAVLQKI